MLMSDLTDKGMPVAISGYDLPVDEDLEQVSATKAGPCPVYHGQ